MMLSKDPIVLNADESMLLLVAKGHEHKDVPFLDDKGLCGGSVKYIERVCKHRCFGSEDIEHPVDMLSIYSGLAEKLLTPRDFIQIMEKLPNGGPYQCFQHETPFHGILSALRFTTCRDTEADVDLIVFDYTHMVCKEHWEQ